MKESKFQFVSVAGARQACGGAALLASVLAILLIGVLPAFAGHTPAPKYHSAHAPAQNLAHVGYTCGGLPCSTAPTGGFATSKTISSPRQLDQIERQGLRTFNTHPVRASREKTPVDHPASPRAVQSSSINFPNHAPARASRLKGNSSPAGNTRNTVGKK